MNESYSFDVRVLGRLWMPGVLATMHITVSADDVCQMAEYDDEMACADVDAYVGSHSGDFSAIVALDVRRVRERTSWERTADGWERSVRELKFEQLSEFTDDEEDAYQECQWGGE